MPRMLRALSMWLLLLPLAALAAPRAWLDRDSIRLGETVTLNVETDARGTGEPDFSVLNADFRRLGTSSSTQLSIVNGRQAARTLWAVALEPTREGTLTIPAFALGAEATAPLTLTVLAAPAGGSAGAGDDVFLEIDAQPPDPYVQQQASYTVRLYFAVTLLEGQLQEPQVTGAQVRRLGSDVTYQKTLADRRYSVVERRYALVPEASGELAIPGPRFAGRALRSGFGNPLGANSVLSALGNSVTLQVRPRPANAPDPWLPAQSLELHDESGALPPVLRVGEPVTLAIRLVAQGLAAEQLPELQLPEVEGAEIYPDQETAQNVDDTQWLRGERVRKFALVPTRAGRIELPQLSVQWWDVNQDRAVTTSLPARSFEVEGVVANPPSADPAPADTPATDEAPRTDGTAPVPAVDWAWPALAALFAVLWIATLLWRRRRVVVAAQTPPPPASPPNVDFRRAWPAALASGDAASAAHALIAAAPSPARNLGDVRAQLDDAAQRDAVEALERALYRGGDASPALSAARAAFAAGPRWGRASVHSADDDLPPLYPDR